MVDELGDLWSKVGGPLSFVVGLLTGHIGPRIFSRIRNRGFYIIKNYTYRRL